uniref:V-type proton ATPase subunit a n=1 Tax=Timema tahoe TaxID=61484 RepID=A0A7R9IB82_9NEOP|nr:unnamed protein product [Timema tahoe]
MVHRFLTMNRLSTWRDVKKNKLSIHFRRVFLKVLVSEDYQMEVMRTTFLLLSVRQRPFWFLVVYAITLPCSYYTDRSRGVQAAIMGAMFRSEEMVKRPSLLYKIADFLPHRDRGLNPGPPAQKSDTLPLDHQLNMEVNAFQRKFVNQVRRCDELERKLRYIEAELNKDSVPIQDNIEELPRAPNPREMIDLEASLEKTESEILELSHNAINLKSNYLELTELRHVLEKTAAFFTEQEGVNGSDSLTRALIAEEAPTSAQTTSIRGRLGFVAGVVPRERVPAFERMLWRISRGNVFLRQADLEEPLRDPNTGNEIYKTVFVAFFQGEQLKSRVKKVCTGFHASLYPCPNVYSEREEMLAGVKTRLEDLNMVLNQTHDHRQRVLKNVAKEVHPWMVMVRKMKAIYHTLNMFNMDVTKKCLIAECWVPVSDLPGVQKALADGGRASGSSIPSFLNVIETAEPPPTFNRTNKFTRGFQNLIDSYGVATYREINPALYTTISFPFLFAIMFGDAGHGLIMLAFGAYMVLGEKKLSKKKSGSEIWNIFFGGRYIMLLMGLFSIYTGIIYNDVFSKSMNLFGSSWQIIYDYNTTMGNNDLTLNPSDAAYISYPYPVGLDPVWQVASNKIIFLNSYKMKLSIIFGVVHMVFGVSLSVLNHFPACAPSVLIMFINMMLFKSTAPPEGCDEFMFEGQSSLQMGFVLIALLCIPDLEMSQTAAEPASSAAEDSEHGDELSEVFIHQAIHTIEYVLSTISHTASYLRLWALSLAHAQLSEVLWNMVMKQGLGSSNYVGGVILYFMFGAWAMFTLAILMGSMFRSEEMALCQLFIQPEAAYTSISELGEAGTVQFRDLNAEVSAFQRRFVDQVRRCDALESKLAYIEAEIIKDEIPILEIFPNEMPRAPHPREMQELEVSYLESEFLVLRECYGGFQGEMSSYGKDVYKTVFAVFFQGDQLRGRIKKVCTGFHAVLYNAPQDPRDREEMLKGVRTRIEDLTKVLNQTEDHRHRVLMIVAKELKKWKVMVFKMKSIYHTLNMFNVDVTQKCLIAECWVPVNEVSWVQKALEEGGKVSGSSVQSFLNVIHTTETPPTFNKTNKFTRGFQNLIDAYAIPSYMEVNPGLFTIITFPFLFAIMFGDAGHGLIMTAFGAYMVLDEKRHMAQRSTNEVWNIFFGGRYIILLMGLFSTYTGFIYNDVFSISMNIFGSSWKSNYDFNTTSNADYLVLDPANETSNIQTPYPFGLDPVWQLASNKIIFLNSFKMKLSIIFGVIHMVIGITVSVINHVKFGRKIKILLEYLPQLLFLLLLFGYMVVMMFIKWIEYGPTNEIKYGPTCAPSILILFINMMLFKSSEVAVNCEEFMFSWQSQLQKALVVMAVICIPVMLLGIPIHYLVSGKKTYDENGEEEPFSEIMIHQSIHTVEYVLSTISHTASYLRLWALSLAHAQLSEILWTKIMNMGMGLDPTIGGIVLFAIFAIWAFFTVSILVMMEGLSAFLHTLRLHW